MLNKSFLRFGGSDATQFTLLCVVFLIAAVILLWKLRRAYIIAPLLVASLTLPVLQQVAIAGIHFSAMRIIVACAWIRCFPELRRNPFRWTTIDKVFLCWALSAAISFILLWHNAEATINRLGFFYDAIGTYFLLRLLLRQEGVNIIAIRTLAVLSFVFGITMTIEHFTRFNVFQFVGGLTPEIRNGNIRAQGPFAHSLLAGCFGASMVPLLAGLWSKESSRLIPAIGIVGATAMVASSFSSTPLIAWAGGIAALCMWPMRRQMRLFRWSVVGVLIMLQLVMKAPVWALIGRFTLEPGSSGYHRFELVNQTILHFPEWALLGIRTTWQWGYNMWDTSNMYVETAVTGGLSTLVLFIAIIVLAYHRVGFVRRSTRDRHNRFFAWALGATVAAHMIAWIGVSYYDQTIVAWYLLIAIISTLKAEPVAVRPESQPADAELVATA